MPDLSEVPEYVRAGLGIAVVPDVARVRRSRTSSCCRSSGAGLDWPLNVVTSAAKPPSRALRTLLDLMTDGRPQGTVS